MLNFKQIIAGFILCSIVALANNADNAKKANANKASSLKNRIYCICLPNHIESIYVNKSKILCSI